MSRKQQQRFAGLSRRQVLGAGAAIGVAAQFKINPIGYARAAASGKVVFYSTMPTSYATKMSDAFNAKKTGVTLEMFFVNGFALYERARAEYTAGKILHDMIMLTDPSLFIPLKKDGRLLDYVSPELVNFPKDQRDPDGLWCNGRTVCTIYGYNTRAVPDGGNLKGWKDFINPKFADGKIGIANALESGSAMQNYYNIRNNKDLGKKFWEELAKLKPSIQSGPSPLTKMNISGETPLALNNDYNLYEESKKGAPIKAVYPDELVTASIIPLACVKGGPNPEGAKVVYDWWLSKEGQTILRDVNSIYSPRADVPPLAGLPKFSDLKIVVASTEELEANRDAMQAEFKEIFKL
jgi:iron(III) transport system substrate-binding protein